MQKFPWKWFCVSVALVLGPAPVYFLAIEPYAETTRDPDSIEFVGWFGGILVMLTGMCCGLVSLAIALQRRNEQADHRGRIFGDEPDVGDV